jgi:hypothetical protein
MVYFEIVYDDIGKMLATECTGWAMRCKPIGGGSSGFDSAYCGVDASLKSTHTARSAHYLLLE